MDWECSRPRSLIWLQLSNYFLHLIFRKRSNEDLIVFSGVARPCPHPPLLILRRDFWSGRRLPLLCSQIPYSCKFSPSSVLTASTKFWFWWAWNDLWKNDEFRSPPLNHKLLNFSHQYSSLFLQPLRRFACSIISRLKSSVDFWLLVLPSFLTHA